MKKLLFLLVMASSGCSRSSPFREEAPVDSASFAKVLPKATSLYKKGPRASREDFIDDHPEEGSLWAPNSQTNYYFTKNKMRGPGDIVVLNIEKELHASILSELKQALTSSELSNEVLLAQAKSFEDLKRKKDKDPKDTKDSKEDAKASEVLDPYSIDERNVTIAPSVNVKEGDNFVGEITERYKNGNYKVRLIKRVNYQNGSPMLVAVTGIIKASEVNDDTDVMNSSKLYDYKVEVSR